MRLGLMILTEEPWRRNVRRWRAAEQLGFDSAWTYDHLHWRGLREGPWFQAVPVLAAAAAATDRITLGVLVASPNFRHPVTLAKDAVTLADISGGRFVLGVGAGSQDAGDAAVLSPAALSPRQRADRFAEFVELTDRLLRSPTTSHSGEYYTVRDAVMIPHCPRPSAPLAVAASGRRGIALAARYADAWVTIGPTDFSRRWEPDECLALVATQIEIFGDACARGGRNPETAAKIFLCSDWAGNPLASPKACLELAERYAALGITELVLNWPRADGPYAGDPDVLTAIAAEALPRIHEL
jgi:alkanesulfonate monooxygenase SsuD/methylene tetrahydromethanopterin reductase-like flavin-dependent oxidoreductase (luciferase family)